MSRTEAHRFVNDLEKRGRLLDDVKPGATGLASIVAMGKSRGYNFTLDEVKGCVRVPNRQDWTNRKLEVIAGQMHGSSVAASTSLVQTTALANYTADELASSVRVVQTNRDIIAIVLLIVVVVAVDV